MVSTVLNVLLLAVLIDADAPKTLRQVNILFRHGDRSPITTFPSDPNVFDKTWPDGSGQLSQQGMKQHFNLGQYFRNRFTGFLNTSYYRNNEIVIRSTDTDRTLQSAYSDLSGLYYPPQGYQQWNPNITKWQPIPVHTYNKSIDTLLRIDCKCNYLEQLMDDTWKSQEVKSMEEKDKAFFAALKKNMSVDYDITIESIWKAIDPLISEKAHNKTWAPFMTEEIFQKMLYYHGLGFYYMFNTTEKQRLRSGILVEQIKKNMERTVNKDSGVPKIFMYSAHDTTVAGLLSGLRVYNKLTPPFASTVFLELHEMTPGQFVVKTYFKNDTISDPTGEPVTMYLPECDGTAGDCTFQQFIKSTERLYGVDFMKECRNIAFVQTLSITQVVVISVIGTAVACLLVGVLCFFLCRRRSQGQYHRAHTDERA